jgi:hypothetical protein
MNARGDVRATREWMEENCPLSWEESWRYSYQDQVGYINGEWGNSPQRLTLLGNLLTALRLMHGDVTMKIDEQGATFTHYKSQKQVMEKEVELAQKQALEHNAIVDDEAEAAAERFEVLKKL